MLFDEPDDVVVLVRRWLEAALAIGSNDELVTVYAQYCPNVHTTGSASHPAY